LRAYLAEALTTRDLIEAGLYTLPEFLVPTMLDHASPTLAAEMVPLVLRGDEVWCQGFSEPGTGSNLASLSCRATRAAGGWEINGQKVWTSLAQYAHRCILLTRTGTPESAHRGITAFFVDMESPRISVRPIQTMHGVEEFCEVFFDGVFVPEDRLLGEVDRGWSIAMDLLPFERSTALWQRAAYLQHCLHQLVRDAPEGSMSADAVGEATELLWALRARSRATQHRLAAGERLGPETSVDKILVASTEQAVFDLAGEALGPQIMLGDDPVSGYWRAKFLYARAATIYGGSVEIQRNIVARRLLHLGEDR
jgi:alkylation response protein AidB-like acyl-CoA dehydrogenase